MAEELNRRSRLATALIAGPAVTVGLLGIGAGPALAEDDEGGTVCSDVTESALESLVEADPGAPAQDGNTVNIPAVPTSGEGHPAFAYLVDGTEYTDGTELNLESDEELTVTVTDAQPGFCLAEDASAYSWTFSGEEVDGESQEVSTFDNGDEEDASWQLDSSVAWQGQALTGSIQGFPEGTEIDLVIEASGEGDETVLDTVATDENGDASIDVDIDDDFEAGYYTFTLDIEDYSVPGVSLEVREAPPESLEEYWWYDAPNSHSEDGGYDGWIQDLIDQSIEPDEDEGRWEYDGDTQVYFEPDLDSEAFGPLTDPDPDFTPGYDTNTTLLGYLEDQDWYIAYDAYGQAVGFVPGESVLEDPPQESISVDSSEVEAGDEITVTAEDYEPGEEVAFTLDGIELGTTEADDEGNVTAELTIPDDLEPGEYTLAAIGDESEFEASLTLTVIDPDSGEDDPVEAELSLDVDEVEVGGEVTAVGEGFEPGEDVEFSLNPELGTVPADDNGEVTAVLTIPEDADLGENTLTAYGVDSEREASAPITVVDSDDDDEGDEPVDPDLSLDTEEVVLEDFLGEADDGEGVGHLVVGLEPGAEVEAVTVGPESVADYVAPHTADENGEISFRIVGFDTASDPSVYLGDYTTVVTFEDEDGDDVELEASFTVVSGDDGTAPPEDDGDDDADDQEPAGDITDEVAGDELAETGVSNTGVGLIAGLLLLIGGALAVFGYRGRFSRKA